MSACADTKYKSVFVMSEEKDECIIATEVSFRCFTLLYISVLKLVSLWSSVEQTLTFLLSPRVPPGVTSHQWAARCSFALWESFNTPSDAALNPRGRCPALRLLLILRRLTDIQSELVLYWKKISAGSVWDKNWRGINTKFTVESKLPLSFLFCLLSGSKNSKKYKRTLSRGANVRRYDFFVFATFAPRPFL